MHGAGQELTGSAPYTLDIGYVQSFLKTGIAASGWVVVALIGAFTGFIACAIDTAEATASDLKFDHCTTNSLLTRETCRWTNCGGENVDKCATFRPRGELEGATIWRIPI